jgi:Tol biopolymer transport system component
MTRLTFDADRDDYPIWTPDGKWIAFHTDRKEAFGSVYWKAAGGTGKEEKLVSALDREFQPWSWSSDGKTLVLMEYDLGGAQSFDIGALSMEGDRKWRPLLKEKYFEGQPQISPDGRWMAYTSDESGQAQIYVRPFPEVDRERWPVSTGRGDSPLWSPDGRELFYRSGDAAMAVSVKTEPTFSLGRPKILFQGKYVSSNFTPGFLEPHPWDIHPDGKRFLMMKDIEDTPSAPEAPRRINIVLNWLEELKQRVPVK